MGGCSLSEFYGIDDQPVAYRRLPLREIAKGIHPEDPQWYTMKKNKPLNKYKDDVFPGELLMALNCVRYPALERVPLLEDEKKESDTGFFWTTKELQMPKKIDFVQLRYVRCHWTILYSWYSYESLSWGFHVIFVLHCLIGLDVQSALLPSS